MTIADACAALNQRQPVRPSHAARVCDECGASEFMWGDEFSAGHPFGTGRMALFCSACGEIVADDGTTETRVMVGW